LPNGASAEAAEPAEIEALAGADPGVLREVVSMLDAAVWARALYGASVVLQAQILPHLPPEAALDVERHLQGRRPLRLREIDEAQQQVLSAWSRVRQNLQQEFRTSTVAASKSAESPVAY
jgi:flagellar motor switch protein FliG